jgi:hypothetical protein
MIEHSSKDYNKQYFSNMNSVSKAATDKINHETTRTVK